MSERGWSSGRIAGLVALWLLVGVLAALAAESALVGLFAMVIAAVLVGLVGLAVGGWDPPRRHA